MVSISALLSHAYVAFAIELDNETERGLGRPVSTVMWFNCLRLAAEEGISPAELASRARTKTNLNGMVRWGYVTLGEDGLIRPTPLGRASRGAWQRLLPVLEQRWRDRYGAETIARLRDGLLRVLGRIDRDLPDCLPILGNGLANEVPSARNRRPQNAPPLGDLPLLSLIAKTLLAFALEFERESIVSLAIAADVLAPIDTDGFAASDLPQAGGVSKEGAAMALNYLVKRDYAVVATENRVRRVALTKKGRDARRASLQRMLDVEAQWCDRFGDDTIAALRRTLEELKPVHPDPYPNTWRAKLPKPAKLPDFPMTLHRGGYPDGS